MERRLDRRAQLGREVLGREHGAARERDGALDAVLELADVPGPRVVHQQHHRLVGDVRDRLLVAFGVVTEEVLGEERNVLAPLAQGRERNRHHLQAVEEVLAKAAATHQLLEITVRRGDDPDVDLDPLLAADALDLVLLQHAQELRLHRRADVADLVEEDRAAARLLEESLLLADGAGEGAAHVAEELALEQRVRERPTVDRDEAGAGAAAVPVQRRRDELLPGAALALDEDGAARRGDARDRLVDFDHRRAAADKDAVRVVGAAVAVHAGVGEPPLGERAPDGRFDLLEVHRLADVVVGAVTDGLDGGLDRAEGGHDDHLDRRVPRLEGTRHRDAVHLRHAHVGDGEIEVLVLGALEGTWAAVARGDAIAFALQHLGQELTRDRVVVDDEELRAHAASPGPIVISTVVPSPRRLCTRTPPSWARAMSWLIVRPRPVPRPIPFVVKKGWKTRVMSSVAMPLPLSLIRTRRPGGPPLSVTASAATTMLPPSSSASTALVSTFKRICCKAFSARIRAGWPCVLCSRCSAVVGAARSPGSPRRNAR